MGDAGASWMHSLAPAALCEAGVGCALGFCGYDGAAGAFGVGDRGGGGGGGEVIDAYGEGWHGKVCDEENEVEEHNRGGEGGISLQGVEGVRCTRAGIEDRSMMEWGSKETRKFRNERSTECGCHNRNQSKIARTGSRIRLLNEAYQ